MGPAATSSLVFACLFGVGFLATRLRAVLPEHHLGTDTKDTVKLAMGLVATMTALVLGLLVASAKGSYDAEKSGIVTMSARLVMLDKVLAHYGPETAPARGLLRNAIEGMVGRLWPDTKSQTAQLDPSGSSADMLYDAIQALSPRNDSQRALKTQALSGAMELGQMRWLLFEQSGSSISVPLLAVVVCWLAILFFSFGLFAPPNNTALVSLLVSAFSVSGAIFLILELDRPFDGLIHISSGPMQLALAHMGK
jgi:hypothetical protein